MRYLIDGYNLLHAWGLAPPRGARAGQLERARLNLLDRLRQAPGTAGASLTVIFDAAGAPAGAAAEHDYHGIRVAFAHDGSADDRIEDLVHRESRPHELTVVSDDHRLRLAAQRHHCKVRRCLDFIEQVQRPRPAAPPAAAAEPAAKPEALSAEENRRLLEEFGEVDGDLF
jgi:predicted RNA-binding protein with PIN domain